MNRISASNNLLIEMDVERWRLLVNGGDAMRVLVEAARGEPLRYQPTFASKHRLPETGTLPTASIQQVVLGWSVKDDAWHLGFILEPTLAAARGSRWCEVAHWYDPEAYRFQEIAARAGERLAQTVERPFNVVPPRTDALASAPAAVPSAPPAPRALPSLPLDLGQWTFDQTPGGLLEFRLAGAWSRAKVIRILWYLFWAAVYLVLSIATLRSGIALPKPEFLPYLGLASAGVLLLLILNMLYQLFSTATRIVIDPTTRSVRGLRGDSQRWRLDGSDIQSVYVTHVVDKRAKRSKGRQVHYGELNLYLQDGKFFHLLQQNALDKRIQDPGIMTDSSAANVLVAGAANAEAESDEVFFLDPNTTHTDLQAAALYCARALNLPCMYDRRLH